MIYEILNKEGKVTNRIVAEPDFVEKNYPGKHRDVTPPPVKEIQENPEVDAITELKSQVADLTKKMDELLAIVKK